MNKNSYLPGSREQGAYTLIEILVAVSIFIAVLAAPTGFFVGSLNVQQKALASQKLLDNTSYVLEYISRALRMAKKDDINGINCLSGNKINYEITASGQGIKFRNYNDECQEFYLEGDRLKESKDGIENYLTSGDLEITSLKFKISGQTQADDDQPRLTLFLNAKGAKGKKPELQPEIKIQTTISQRNLDVPR